MAKEIMSAEEKLQLEQLNENPILLSALKKIFLADIYINGTLDTNPMGNEYQQNFAFGLQFDQRGQELARTNEDLGKALRACNEALRMISLSFTKIKEFQKIIEIKTENKVKR